MVFVFLTRIDEVFLVSVESYVRSLGRPDLLDLVALPTLQDVNMDDVEDLRPSKRKLIYGEVCPLLKSIIIYLRMLTIIYVRSFLV